ncbi:MAG TPA: methyltransferase domain-containing protein [Thermoleophilaceae bacterium]|nr:methyltransferase domain-containing protein [Thermoleophilaceae bacterium]
MDPRELAGYRGHSPERFVPELMEGEMIEAQHIGRYLWASSAARGRRVLDAGCGVAYGSTILAEAGARSVVGVDLAEDVLETVRERVPPSVRLERADLRDLPFDDGSFDLVVCFEVIEHIADQKDVTREFARILSPEGLLLTSTPNRAVSAQDNPHHLGELLPEELESLLGEHFATVELFRQEAWYSSAIFNDSDFKSNSRSASGSWPVWKIAGRDLGTEEFTIAAGSDTALPELGGSIVLTNDRNTTQWARDQSEKLKEAMERLREAQEQLAEAKTERRRLATALAEGSLERRLRRSIRHPVTTLRSARQRIRRRAR